MSLIFFPTQFAMMNGWTDEWTEQRLTETQKLKQITMKSQSHKWKQKFNGVTKFQSKPMRANEKSLNNSGQSTYKSTLISYIKKGTPIWWLPSLVIYGIGYNVVQKWYKKLYESWIEKTLNGKLATARGLLYLFHCEVAPSRYRNLKKKFFYCIQWTLSIS